MEITPDPAKISYDKQNDLLCIKWIPKIYKKHTIHISYKGEPLRGSPWKAIPLEKRNYKQLLDPNFEPIVVGREGMCLTKLHYITLDVCILT